MKLVKATFKIKETEDGWLLNWDSTGTKPSALTHHFLDEDIEFHETAAEAMRAVKDIGKVFVDAGVSTLFRIKWEPTTKIGRMVVKALQT